MPKTPKFIFHIYALLPILICTLIFYHPLVSAERLSSGADMTSLFYPLKFLLTKSLRSGVIPLWNPYKFGGAPFVAPMQSGVFYPLNWLVCLIFPVIAGINAYILLHLVLLGYFCFLLFVLGFDVMPSVALMFSLIIPLGGLAQAQVEHLAALAAITWLPLIILSYLRLLKQKNLFYFLLFIITTALQVLAGHPQYVAYTFFFLIIYTIYWLLSDRTYSLKERITLVFGVMVASGFAFLLSAVQLLPTLIHSKVTYRAISGFGYAASFSLPPKFLLTLINPGFSRHPTGDGNVDLPFTHPEFNLYFGLVPLLLLFFSIVYFFKHREGKEIFLFVLSVFFVIFALGDNTPLFKIILTVFLFLENYRVPPRILCLALLIWALLPAKFLSIIIIRRPELQKYRFLLTVLFLIVFLDLYVNSRNEAFNFTTPINPIQKKLPEQKNILTPSGENFYRTFRLMTRDDDYFLRQTSAAVYERFVRLQPDVNVIFSIPIIGGYEEGLLPSIRYKDFLLTYNRNIRNPAPDSLLLSLLNVRYIYCERDLPISSKRFRFVANIASYKIFENLDWRGAVFWCSELQNLFRLEALDGTFYRTGRLKYTFGTEFITDYISIPFSIMPDKVSRGLKISQKDCNTIILDVKEGTGDVLISLPAYEGWNAYFPDGTYKRLQQVNAIMQCITDVSSPARITLRYEPFSFRFGLYLSLSSLMILIIILLLKLLIKKFDTFASKTEKI